MFVSQFKNNILFEPDEILNYFQYSCSRYDSGVEAKIPFVTQTYILRFPKWKLK